MKIIMFPITAMNIFASAVHPIHRYRCLKSEKRFKKKQQNRSKIRAFFTQTKKKRYKSLKVY